MPPKKKKFKSIQDKISEDPQLIKEALAGLYYVPQTEVARLPKYIWIRYITNQGKYRTGGILWGNFYPKHLVLLNPKSRYPWRVQIATNHFYIRDNKAKLREKYEKEKLHELYLDGKLEIKKEVLSESDNIDTELEKDAPFNPLDYAPIITTVSREFIPEITNQITEQLEEIEIETKKEDSKITTRSVGTCTSPVPEYNTSREDPQIVDLKNKLLELYNDNLLTLNDPEEAE